MKHIRNISRVLVGIVFLFSGFVKAIDPLGSAYKFGDYFSAFGISFLHPFAIPLAIILSSAELTMGVALILSFRMRFFSKAVLVFMTAFTIITLILAIYNPITDCGCFGDALILTNWETFWKNIVILVFVLFIFFQKKYFIPFGEKFIEWLVIIIVFLFTSWFSFYSYNHLPLLDFRPYHIGSDIPVKMIIPPDAPRDIYETKLIYKNKQTGSNEEFSVEDFPRDTSLYSFVDAVSDLIKKGYEPPIHDFTINSRSGAEITDMILQDQGYSFLLIAHDLSRANKDGLIKAEEYDRFARLCDNLTFYCLTASGNQKIEEILNEIPVSYEFYHVDEITLKTIIRSNPGLVLLKNGVIVGKWHFNDFPHFGKDITGNSFREIMDNYPFSPGTLLKNFDTPPPGAAPDVYETTLYYRNLLTDSIAVFSIDNFPQTEDWIFLKSESRMIKAGFIHPLNAFKPITPEGLDISRDIVYGKDNTFIVFLDDINNVDHELLERLNKLFVMTAAIDTAHFSFYGVTGMDENKIIDFASDFAIPIQFAKISSDLIHQIAGDGIALVWIRNGKVMAVRKDNSIPTPVSLEHFLTSEPEVLDAEKILISDILNDYRQRWEKRGTYLFILGLIIFGLVLRLYFQKIKPGDK